jgi:hypothetical protein
MLVNGAGGGRLLSADLTLLCVSCLSARDNRTAAVRRQGNIKQNTTNEGYQQDR